MPTPTNEHCSVFNCKAICKYDGCGLLVSRAMVQQTFGLRPVHAHKMLSEHGELGNLMSYLSKTSNPLRSTHPALTLLLLQPLHMLLLLLVLCFTEKPCCTLNHPSLSIFFFNAFIYCVILFHKHPHQLSWFYRGFFVQNI